MQSLLQSLDPGLRALLLAISFDPETLHNRLADLGRAPAAAPACCRPGDRGWTRWALQVVAVAAEESGRDPRLAAHLDRFLELRWRGWRERIASIEPDALLAWSLEAELLELSSPGGVLWGLAADPRPACRLALRCFAAAVLAGRAPADSQSCRTDR